MNKKSLRIAGWAIGLSLAFGAIGTAVGASQAAPIETGAAAPAGAVVKYTLAPVAGGDSGYATDSDLVVSGKTWNVTGNSNMVPWRIGGKNLSGVDRSIYSKTAIAENISYIEIDVGAASSVTVNGMNVGVYSTAAKAEAGGKGDIANFTPSFSASSTISISKSDSTSWSNCFYNITFNVTIGGSNKFIAFSEARFYAVSVPLTGISSVSLSHDTAPANYSKEITATATYTPDGTANEAIVWTSSDENVATIAQGETYNEAIITPVGEGVCHFTASNTSGSIACNSGDFTVTAPLVRDAFNISFAHQASDSTKAFENPSAATEKLLGDTDAVSVSAVASVFSGAGDTFKLGGGSAQGSITFALEEDVKTVIVEAKNYGTDSTSVIATLGSTSKPATALSSELCHYVYHFDSGANSFTIAASAASKQRFYIKSIAFVVGGHADAQGAYDFAANLLDGTNEGCANQTVSTLSSAWSALSGALNTAEASFAGTKTYFKGVEKDDSGNLVEKAAARYDYIVGKYLKTLGNESFNDFAERDPDPVNGLGAIAVSRVNSNIPLIIAVLGTGLAAAGGLLFLHRRNRKED